MRMSLIIENEQLLDAAAKPLNMRYYSFDSLIFTNYGGIKMSVSLRSVSILTVCTGNICRSPMAEGFLGNCLRSSPDVTVYSAGTHALVNNPATEFAVIAALEKGINISGHRARMLEPRLIQESSIILCMEPSHAEWVLSLEPSAHKRVHNLADFSGPHKRLKRISDPYGCGIPDYRKCLRDIEECLKNFLESEKFFCFITPKNI